MGNHMAYMYITGYEHCSSNAPPHRLYLSFPLLNTGGVPLTELDERVQNTLDTTQPLPHLHINALQNVIPLTHRVHLRIEGLLGNHCSDFILIPEVTLSSYIKDQFKSSHDITTSLEEICSSINQPSISTDLSYEGCGQYRCKSFRYSNQMYTDSHPRPPPSGSCH